MRGPGVRASEGAPPMLRVAQLVRAPGCGPGGQRFKPAHAPHGTLAQLVERQIEDLRVSGSIPEGPTIYGRMPESGQKGRTVNPLASACVGSNPTSPTNNSTAHSMTNVPACGIIRTNIRRKVACSKFNKMDPIVKTSIHSSIPSKRRNVLCYPSAREGRSPVRIYQNNLTIPL